MSTEHGMIEPFESGQVRNGAISYGCSSFGYDIRVADEYKVFTNVHGVVVDPKAFDARSFVDISGEGHCLIPPNSFALARTLEYFRIPSDTLVICVGKSTYARCFSGDTRVALVDGTSATLEDMAEGAERGESFWGYSVGPRGRVIVSMLERPRFIGRDALLEIELPRLSAGHRIVPKLEGLSLDDVKREFSKYLKLPLGAQGKTVIDYEGRHLVTGEVVERMKIHLPLLATGAGAVSYFVKEIEQVCRLRGIHAALAPLVQAFLEKLLFERETNIFDPALVSRLGDPDVVEHIRAVFVPLVRTRTTTTEERLPDAEPIRLSRWKPFQVTHSETHPVLDAVKTLFNLVPCNRELELAIAKYLDRAPDVAAFAANTGPQALRIDYLAIGGRLAFYKPDFFVRTEDGHCFLVETKGREDRDVARKARAAIAWCEAASSELTPWEYLYVPQGVFERLSGDHLEELARASRPALTTLLDVESADAEPPLLAAIARADAERDEKAPEVTQLVPQKTLDALPDRYRKAVTQGIMLYSFFEKKEGMNYAPAFGALLGSLDEAARGLLKRRLQPAVPPLAPEAEDWFDPIFDKIDRRKLRHYQDVAKNLKKTLVYESGISPLGLLRSCMDYALNDTAKLGGVFATIKEEFQVKGGRDILAKVQRVNDFRNTHIAHQEQELTEASLAKKELLLWVDALHTLTELP